MTATGFAAVFEEEDGRRAQEGEIAGEERIANRTVILALRGVAPIVLTGFNSPVATYLLQQPRRGHLLGIQTGDAVAHVLAGLVNLAATEVVKLAVDAEDLGRTGESQRRAIDGNANETPLLQPAVFLAGRLGLRGEESPPAIAELWPRRWADCPSEIKYNPRPVAG